MAAERPTSHKAAAETLGDAHYLAYCLAQACRLLIALMAKRWPFLS